MEKLHMNKRKLNTTKLLFILFITLSFSLWLYLLFFSSTSPTTTTGNSWFPLLEAANPCENRYVYVHNLPPRFNQHLISSCHNLSQWTDMCPFLSNSGLGPPLQTLNPNFYNTNQFSLELIFHTKMQNYKCITRNSSLASAVYVPYYAGLDIGRYLWGFNTSVLDSGPTELVKWLKSQPEWSKMGGMDHFLVAGRITWDFRRLSEDGAWGSKFFLMPEARNMTCLLIESSPWHSNEISIPYPTYFHPSTENDVIAWQEKVLGFERKWLFSFAGAPRPNMTESIRDVLIGQCRSSEECRLLECYAGANESCHSPESVMEVFQSSIFCLQPQGDSYTRRSLFDSMLAGCIPVLFHPGTAYVQYTWHLPRNYTEYSVFISEGEVRQGRVRVEDVLKRFDDEDVKRMREEVVRLIPRLVYGDPRGGTGIKDAFDVAVEGVVERVDRVKREMREGRYKGVEDEQNSWKHALGVEKGEHEWDHFFFKQK